MLSSSLCEQPHSSDQRLGNPIICQHVGQSRGRAGSSLAHHSAGVFAAHASSRPVSCLEFHDCKLERHALTRASACDSSHHGFRECAGPDSPAARPTAFVASSSTLTTCCPQDSTSHAMSTRRVYKWGHWYRRGTARQGQGRPANRPAKHTTPEPIPPQVMLNYPPLAALSSHPQPPTSCRWHRSALNSCTVAAGQAQRGWGRAGQGSPAGRSAAHAAVPGGGQAQAPRGFEAPASILTPSPTPQQVRPAFELVNVGFADPCCICSLHLHLLPGLGSHPLRHPPAAIQL